jgi:hypothetical protein
MNKVYTFFVLVLTVLTVHLLTGGIIEYLMNYKHITHPLKFTLFGMMIIVVILYPAFKYMDRIITRLTAHLLFKGGGAIGIFFVFLILFTIMYWFYAMRWFHIDALKYALSFIR